MCVYPRAHRTTPQHTAPHSPHSSRPHCPAFSLVLSACSVARHIPGLVGVLQVVLKSSNKADQISAFIPAPAHRVTRTRQNFDMEVVGTAGNGFRIEARNLKMRQEVRGLMPFGGWNCCCCQCVCIASFGGWRRR